MKVNYECRTSPATAKESIPVQIHSKLLLEFGKFCMNIVMMRIYYNR